MSAAIENASLLANNFPHKLCFNEYGKQCGEVFITQRQMAILRCCLCEEEHRIYQEFLDHIFEHFNANAKSAGLQHAPDQEDPLMTPAIEYEEEQPLMTPAIEYEEEQPLMTPAIEYEEEQPQKSPLPGQILLVKIPNEDDAQSNVQIPLEEPTNPISTNDRLEPTESAEAADTTATDVSKEIPETIERQNTAAGQHASDSESSPEPWPELPPLPPEKRKRKPRMVKPKQPRQRIHKCETCGKDFMKRQVLELHRRRHTGDARFPCEMCPKKFYRHADLAIHERRHRREHPFICKYCGAGFANGGCRNRHERGHEVRMNNIRAHKCELCEKAFFDAEQLKKHLRVHAKVRNYVCVVCNAAFYAQNTLRVHMKLHANAHEYVCGVCGKGFNQSAARFLHMRDTHKVFGATRTKDNSEASTSNTEL